MKRRVLLLSYCLDYGGSERQLAEIARSMDPDTYEMHVGCLECSGLREPELRAAGIPIVQFPMRSFFSFDAVVQSLRLVSYIHRHKIDLVHAFDVPMDIFGAPAAKLSLRPVVLTSQRAHRSLTQGARGVALAIGAGKKHDGRFHGALVRGRFGLAGSQDFDAIVFDHHIGEQFFAGGGERSLGRFGIRAIDFDVEHLALPHGGDSVDAERMQSAFDRLALRIEHTGFQGDGNAGFHARKFPLNDGSAREKTRALLTGPAWDRRYAASRFPA